MHERKIVRKQNGNASCGEAPYFAKKLMAQLDDGTPFAVVATRSMEKIVIHFFGPAWVQFPYLMNLRKPRGER